MFIIPYSYFVSFLKFHLNSIVWHTGHLKMGFRAKELKNFTFLQTALDVFLPKISYKKKPHLVVLSSTTSSFWPFWAIFCLIPISSCHRYPQIRFGYPGSPLDFIHILQCFFPPSFYHHEHLHFGLMLSDTFRP